MKHLQRIAAITLLVCIYSFNGYSQGNPAPNVASKENVFKVKVDFHCGGGKHRIENHFKDMEGVKSTTADLATKDVTIVHNPDVISTKKLVLEIEKAGHRTDLTPKDRKVESKCSHGAHDHDHTH